MMAQGTFRSDLYYRLNVYTICLPPLRERPNDLPLLVNHFLNRFSRELNKPVRDVSLEAMELLTQYEWPGNIRELQSVLKHAVVEARGSAILPEFLPEAMQRVTPGSKSIKATQTDCDTETNELLIKFIRQQIQSGTEDLYNEVVNRVERVMLTELLHQVDANISRASTILGVSRSTLRVKLAALGIKVDRTIRVAE